MNIRLSSATHRRTAIVALALACLTVQGCMDAANGSVEEAKKDEVAAIPVEVATVANGDVAAYYSGTTTIEADEQATVVSQITGVVLEINAEEGDYVAAGTVLAKIETDRYELELARGNAALKRLEMDYQRKKELFDKKLVSADDFERVSAEYQAQKAAVGLAELDLRYTSIRAPISGYVSERLVRAGNLVELYQPVYRITSYDPLLAVLNVPERELAVLRKGLEVTVKLDALPEQTFSGQLTRISPVIDPGTGTFRVTAEIKDPERLLKPGLFGRVDILYDLRQGVPLIPRSAIITEDEASHVFVVEADSSVVRRSVRLGYERNGLVEIVEGVNNGDRVVTAGKGSLSDGARVEVVGLPGGSPQASPKA
jgi:membrane fusion protein (multidrug efflux system)